MLFLRLNKFISPNLSMAFSKIKPNPLQAPVKPTLKGASAPFKSAPISQPNLKPGLKSPKMENQPKVAIE